MPDPITTPAPALTAGDYLNTFGDVGARWFYEGKSFAAATHEFIAKLRSDHQAELAAVQANNEAVRAENEKLKRDVQLLRGNDPASFSVNDKWPHAAKGSAKEERQMKTGQGPAAAAYTQGIEESLSKLPPE